SRCSAEKCGDSENGHKQTTRHGIPLARAHITGSNIAMRSSLAEIPARVPDRMRVNPRHQFRSCIACMAFPGRPPHTNGGLILETRPTFLFRHELTLSSPPTN